MTEEDSEDHGDDVAPPRPVPGALFQYILLTADDPVLSTSEVADELPIGERATLKRLQSLADDGYVEKKKPGGKAYVWWVEGVSERLLEETLLSGEATDTSQYPSHEMARHGTNWAKINAINKNRRK